MRMLKNKNITIEGIENIAENLRRIKEEIMLKMLKLGDKVEIININNLNGDYKGTIGQQGKIIMIDNVTNINKTYYTVNIPNTNKYVKIDEDKYIMDNRMVFLEENLKLVKKENDVKMNNKQEYINELEEIKNQQKQLAEKMELLQKKIERKDSQKESWNPKYGEKYYIIDKLGKANFMMSRSSIYDRTRINNLNCFKTQEEAERVAFEQLLHRKLKKFALENNNQEINWNIINQEKYRIYYDYEEQILVVDWTKSTKNLGQIYFTSKDVAEKSIEKFKDDLIRYFVSDK